MFEGKIILVKDMLFRVIFESNEICVLCKLNTTKLDLQSISTVELRRMFRSGEAVEAVDQQIVTVDFEHMSENDKSSYQKNRAIVDKISEVYGPAFLGLMGKQPKPVIDELISSQGVTRKTVLKIVRLYLQSGLQNSSLIDGRSCYHLDTPNTTSSKMEYTYKTKTGPKTKDGITIGMPLTQELRSQFDEAVNAFLSKRETSIKNAFIGLLDNHYSVRNPVTGMRDWVPESERPTLKQFYHYCSSRISLEDKLIAKTSKPEVRNNNRAYTSSARADSLGPGFLAEADACECSLVVVSEINPEKSIGKPVVYALVDTYSGIINAVSASFDNNSYVGLTSLFINLAEDKTAYARKYGIELKDSSLWPSCFIPTNIRCDKGSDFRSDIIAKVYARNGINRDLEPAATGSMKPFVEKSFHQFEMSWRDEMEHYGLIQKRHDSDHHKTAMLTLYEFTQMLIGFVIIHNQRVMSEYPMTRDMLKTPGLIPTPLNVWNYGCDHFGKPRPISEAERPSYFYNLLIEKKATITRRGVKYKGLHYNNPEDLDLAKAIFNAEKNAGKRNTSGEKLNDIKVRIDPRDAGHLFYLVDGKLSMMSLQPMIPDESAYADMTWLQYEQYYSRRNEIRREGKKFNLYADSKLKEFYGNVKANASSEHLVDNKDNREIRLEDKNIVSHRNSIASKIDENPVIEIAPQEEIADAATTVENDPWANWTPDADVDMEEVINDFKERNK